MPLAILPWTGSSPHTRGARPGCRRPRCLRGIIPAYAGSTLGTRRWWARMRDHPRIRGEHLRDVIIDAQQRGSSPHTRGALSEVRQIAEEARIIPAYAGSTTFRKRLTSSKVDHPRIRGEHRGASPGPSGISGSSPHTRGALPPAPQRRKARRIIPAYAGSTYRSRGAYRSSRDHPRIRGEHMSLWRRAVRCRGSSPHTRGAHVAVVVAAPGGRIIPAYAGSTTAPDRWVRIGQGSSPHTRGALL